MNITHRVGSMLRGRAGRGIARLVVSALLLAVVLLVSLMWKAPIIGASSARAAGSMALDNTIPAAPAAPPVWTDMAGGMTNGIVYALAHDGTTLYAAGSQWDSAGTCTSANTGTDGCNAIAKWDGTSWTPLGFGLNNKVYALLVDGTDLYAGGEFTAICGNAQCNAGNTPANHIAKWDGTTWTAVGTGTNLDVDALAKLGSNVIAGGRFTVAGTCNPCRHVAQWDGTTWSPVGFGVDAQVSALAVNGTTLYAGGTFVFICDNIGCGSTTDANYIAQWDGTAWTPLNFGVGVATAVGNPSVVALAVDASGDLYAGGVFLSVCGNAACDSGNTTVNNLAKWDGSAWSALGSGLTDAEARAFAFNGSTLYVGGRFNFAGSQNIVQWNGSAFSGLGGGAGGAAGSIQAIVLDSSNVYIGGNFFNAAGGACQACDAVAQMQTPGSIRIVKDADPDDGTPFVFGQDIDGSGAFTLTHAMSTTFGSVAPASYYISETLPSGWYMSLVNCQAASGNPVTTGIDYPNAKFSLDLLPGEVVTCTVSNKLYASLTIKKEAQGGDATFPFSSPFFPSSTFSLTTVSGMAQITFGQLPSNITYTVYEGSTPGWAQTGATCDNGDTPDAVFLAPGDDVTCTFSNQLEPTPTPTPTSSPTATHTPTPTSSPMATNTPTPTATNTPTPTATRPPTSLDMLGLSADLVSSAKCGTATGADCVRVTWLAGREDGLAGYRIMRSMGYAAGGVWGERVEVTTGLILAQGQDTNAYAWSDATTQAGMDYAYWLVAVDVNGAIREYGPVTATPGSDTIELGPPGALD